jgi:hypothetical protein
MCPMLQVGATGMKEEEEEEPEAVTTNQLM